MIGSLDDMDDAIPDLLDWLRFNVEFEKAKFSSRSEAGKYAAHIRWMNQRGLTPLSAEAWVASQGMDATPVVAAPLVPSRLTITGMDWDAPPPVFKNVEDAMNWLQAKWGGKEDRFVVPMSTPNRLLKSAYLAQPFGVAMDNLFKFAPEIAETIDLVSWEQLASSRGWGSASRSGKYVEFYENVFTATFIEPDGTVLEGEDYLLFKRQMDKYTGFKASASVSSTFYHEFGHHIGFTAGNKALYGDIKEVKSSLYADSDDHKKYTREIAKLVSPILREHYGVPGRARIDIRDNAQSDLLLKISKDLSRYATTNYDELIAESASQYFSAKFEPDQPPASPIAIKIIETLLNYTRGESK
jgi:hypothetical protein